MNSAFLLSQMLNLKGRTVTIETPGVETYDPNTGTYSGGTPTTTTVKAYMAANMLEQDQSSVQGERSVLVSAVDTSGNPTPVPKNGDIITGFRDAVVVVDFQEISEGDTTSCFICGVNE